MAIKPDVIAHSLLFASKIIEKEITEPEETFNIKSIDENREKIRQELV